jgi:mRNA-degrading endonuclease RelE of RelBE toxin-antitoxin system
MENNHDPVAQEKVVQEKGMHLLQHIRQIEADCIAQQGEFDWEKLPEELRAEYDDLCALLDQLRDTGERIPFRELLRQEREAHVGAYRVRYLIDDAAQEVTVTRIDHRRDVYD